MSGLTTSQIAVKIGINAAYLLSVIASCQAVNGWRAVGYFNGQLQQQLGLKTFKTFAAARQAAVDAELLHYHGTGANQRGQGTYWVIPLTSDHCQKLPMMDKDHSQKMPNMNAGQPQKLPMMNGCHSQNLPMVDGHQSIVVNASQPQKLPMVDSSHPQKLPNVNGYQPQKTPSIYKGQPQKLPNLLHIDNTKKGGVVKIANDPMNSTQNPTGFLRALANHQRPDRVVETPIESSAQAMVGEHMTPARKAVRT